MLLQGGLMALLRAMAAALPACLCRKWPLLSICKCLYLFRVRRLC